MISLTRLGAATGNAQGRVSEIIRGHYEVRTVKSLDRIAEGLGMPDHARVALGLAPTTQQHTAGAPTLPALPAQGPAVPAPYPSTTGEAVRASTSLWQADASRVPELISAPLEPAAWTSAALAWLVSDDATPAPETGPGRAVGRSEIGRASCRE